MESTEFFASPINGNRIVFGESGDEVVSIGFTNVFNTKVIDNEGKLNRPGLIEEEASCVRDLVETGSGKFGDHLLIGQA